MAHDLSVEQYNSQVSAVWRATIILSIVTIIEVAIALFYMQIYPNGDGPRMLLNVGFIMMSLLKAYFIVGEFMHLRYETRALIITILAPLFFLIWFIVAFLWEGAEWQNNRVFWGVEVDEHRATLQGHGTHGEEGQGHGDTHAKPAEEHKGH